MKKMKQIIPCEGWVAVVEKELEEYEFLPIACWALTESNAVVPIVSHEGKMIDATTREKFIEAIPEEMMLGDPDDDDDD